MSHGKRGVAALLMLSLACSSLRAPSARRPPSTHRTIASSNDVVRYRLLLRENPVDPGEAFRCHGRCQSEETPTGYWECLGTCPGFDITPNEYCSKYEVPPVAACLTVRRIPITKEPDPELVVLAVIGSFMLVVGAATLCSASRTHCSSYGYYPY